jgi:DNA polymerase III epsilon subunit-like protein
LTIVAIDFEASCLPRHGRSFPIEVGVASFGRSQSWLIRPHESWAGWDWTAEAQALHGITRDRLYRDGLPVEAVLDRLFAAMDGRRAVADSTIDQYWLETLAQAAGEQAPFMIDHVSILLNEHGAGESRIASAVAYADLRHPERHRAAADAAWLSALLDHVAGDARAMPALPIAAMRKRASMGFSNNL